MTYRGINIYRNEGGGMTGARLRYWAFTDSGQIAANTLQEMRELIREQRRKEGLKDGSKDTIHRVL